AIEASGLGTFDVGVDVGLTHTGRASATLRAGPTVLFDDEFATLRQGIRADDLRGKRVKLSGYLQPTRGMTGTASIWMRVDGPGMVLAFDNRPVANGDSWQLAFITADIPANAIGVSFGVVL